MDFFCYVVFWSLWDQRNNVVFENKQPDWSQLVFLVKLRLGFWLKGWNPNCPFSPGEVVQNLDSVRLWKKRKEIEDRYFVVSTTTE